MCAVQPAAGTVYKCVGNDGSISYSDGPCAANSAGGTDKASESPAAVPPDVVALRNIVIALGGDELAPALDSFAVLQLRVIGTGDETWKGSHPNWTPLFNMVRQDLRRDLEPVYQAQLPERARIWDQALASDFSSGQIDQLLDYYHSAIGQRYLAFQRRLMAIQGEAIGAVVVGMAAGGMPAGNVSAPASQSVIDDRERLLAISWMSLALSAMSDTQKDSGTEFITNLAAKVRGNELDELLREYRPDLQQFDTFQKSAPAKALLVVYGKAAKEEARSQTNGDPFISALNNSVRVHSPAWKAAYLADRSAAVAQQSSSAVKATTSSASPAQDSIARPIAGDSKAHANAVGMAEPLAVLELDRATSTGAVTFTSAAWSPDGRLIALSGGGAKMDVLQANNLTQLKSLKVGAASGLLWAQHSAAFSADGRLLVAGYVSWCRTARMRTMSSARSQRYFAMYP
jgi:hypothetical protein